MGRYRSVCRLEKVVQEPIEAHQDLAGEGICSRRAEDDVEQRHAFILAGCHPDSSTGRISDNATSNNRWLSSSMHDADGRQQP